MGEGEDVAGGVGDGSMERVGARVRVSSGEAVKESEEMAEAVKGAEAAIEAVEKTEAEAEAEGKLDTGKAAGRYRRSRASRIHHTQSRPAAS